jgi:hypothetical protein
MSQVNSGDFSYLKHAKTMVAMVSDIAGCNLRGIADVIEDINESQMGIRMRSEKTGRVETMIYIDTLYSSKNDRELPEVTGWTFRPRSHSLQEHINLVTIYND